MGVLGSSVGCDMSPTLGRAGSPTLRAAVEFLAFACAFASAPIVLLSSEARTLGSGPPLAVTLPADSSVVTNTVCVTACPYLVC